MIVTKKSVRCIATLTAFIASLFSFGCAAAEPGPITRGRLVEMGTGDPIAGAIVVARWRESRSALVDSSTVCIHVETTSERGRVPGING